MGAATPSRFRNLMPLSVVALVACGWMPRLHADAVLEGTKPAQWRLVWHQDPATSATLCWNTARAGSQHLVRLREDGTDKVRVVSARRSGRYSAKHPDLFYHHAELTDLRPATKYHVVMESNGCRSPEMYFVTAPANDVPVSVIFGADSRSGREARRQMNAMLARMLDESDQGDRAPIIAFAHGGDFIVNGRELDQWSRWMSDHELTVGADGRMLPIIPARGNHDGGRMFNEVFAFPSRHKNFYALNLTAQVRLITLNTETSTAGDQLKWLAGELPDSRNGNRWLFVQYHRPSFPAVKIPPLNLIHWVPLFEEHHVDLVCEGDGHVIKRTAPLRDMKIDASGVVYVGEGGLGVGQRTPKAHRWYLNSPLAKTGQGHHVQLLTFQREELTCRVVLLGGDVFDEVHLSVRPATQRGGADAPAPPSGPEPIQQAAASSP